MLPAAAIIQGDAGALAKLGPAKARVSSFVKGPMWQLYYQPLTVMECCLTYAYAAA
jgi:hypothetical protein